jgi:hypothetical protein
MNAAPQPRNIAMCVGAGCLETSKHVTTIKHESIICTFDVEQKILFWRGPAGPAGD